MFCPTASTASGTTACWPVRPTGPTSQKSAHYFASNSLNRPSRQNPRPRSFHSPCASHAPAVAAPCALSRSSDEARNRCRAHHPGSRRHDTSPVVCQRTPPAAHRRPGPDGVRLSFLVTTCLPENAHFKIAIGAIEKDHGSPKHLAQLPPHPRHNRRLNRSHSFPIARSKTPTASSFRGLSTRAATSWPPTSHRGPRRKTFREGDLR